MKDEPLFLALAQKVSDYLTRFNDERALARVALRRMEHFYYKSAVVYAAMRKHAAESQQQSAADDEAAAQVRREILNRVWTCRYF